MLMRATILAVLMMASSSLPPNNARAADPVHEAGPTVSGGTCTFKTTEIATASSFDQSTSASFVKLRAAGSIVFTQDKTGCVAGTFFANAGNGEEGDHVLLRVLLDGASCGPLAGGYIFANSGTDFTSHSVAFFCGARITPGRHTVEVQYASGLGGSAEVFQRTLDVSHE